MVSFVASRVGAVTSHVLRLFLCHKMKLNTVWALDSGHVTLTSVPIGGHVTLALVHIRSGDLGFIGQVTLAL